MNDFLRRHVHNQDNEVTRNEVKLGPEGSRAGAQNRLVSEQFLFYMVRLNAMKNGERLLYLRNVGEASAT